LLERTVISDFCKDSDPSQFQEAGCAVCGQLTPMSKLTHLHSVKGFLSVLENPGVTRVERKIANEPICGFKGPVLDYSCDKVCNNCRASVRNGNVPQLALAKGLWIGKVPKELVDL
jgi:hypothetical protein